MKDSTVKPSLRISHIVYGRVSEGHRVTYLIDPKGDGENRAVPETVVLTRWRKRVFPGYTFSGARLSSTLWRAVAMAFGSNAKTICKLSKEELESISEASREILSKNGFLKLPSSDVLHAIFAICLSDRLQKILDWHLSDAHKDKSGVPDLFLFAKSAASKNFVMGRFVEVKKPNERVSIAQKEEIDFLNGLGLNARVLRLIER